MYRIQINKANDQQAAGIFVDGVGQRGVSFKLVNDMKGHLVGITLDVKSKDGSVAKNACAGSGSRMNM